MLTAWLLLAGTAQAATLSGFVTDADNGEALTRVTVAVEGLQLATVSNNSGYYAVVQVPAGTHVVSSSHTGYQTWRDTLHFGVHKAVRLDVALVPKPMDMGGEVSMEAERISLRPQPLQQLPALGEADLLRGLQLLPGVQAVADISSGLYVRGGGPEQTAILLDQIPLYNPSHLFGLFSTFNPDAIKKVDLYKGAYPAPYGRTLGAILDVSNREGNRKRTSGRGGVSLISGRLLTEGPVGQGSWLLAGRRTYLDGVFSALRARGEDIPLNYFFYDLNGNINQRRGDDTYAASAYWGQDDLRIELEDDEESFVDMSWGNRVLTARWTRAFSPALFGHLMAAGSEYESIVALRFLDAPVRIANSIRDLSLKGDVDYFANRHHTLSLGLLATLFEFHFVRSFNERTQLDLRQEPVLLEGYVQDEWQPRPTTRVQARWTGNVLQHRRSLAFHAEAVPEPSVERQNPRQSRRRSVSPTPATDHHRSLQRRRFLGASRRHRRAGAILSGRHWRRVDPFAALLAFRGCLLHGPRQPSDRGYRTARRQRRHALGSRVQKRRHGLGQRSRGLFTTAHRRTHRVDRLRARLDAAHLPRTQRWPSLSPQARPPPRPVFRRLLRGGRMAARREPGVRHRAGIHTGLRVTFPAQQRPPTALSPPRCQR